MKDNTPRYRIEAPHSALKQIAVRCNCSEGYVRKVLSGKCSQKRTDLQRKISRVAMRMIDED